MKFNLSAPARWVHRASFTLVSLALCTLAQAHEFWLVPSSFEPRTGEAVAAELRVGDGWPGEVFPRDPTHLRRFVAVDAEGERAVPGAAGAHSVGSITTRQAGATWLVYQSAPRDSRLDAKAFESYLLDEGLEHVIAKRAAARQSHTPSHELYARNVKSLLRVQGDGSGYDRNVGLPLEIVLETDPAKALSNAALNLRVLLRGKPAAGLLVRAWPQGAPRVSGVKGRTDAEGRVRLPVTKPGVLLISTVQIQASPAGSDHDWDSQWSSLTLSLPPRP